MPTKPLAHPPADSLQAFGLGKLDITTAEEVLRHLENCPDCRGKMAALPGDSFLNQFRDAHGQASTPTRSAAGSGMSSAATRLPFGPPPVPPNLLPELANNPQYQVLRELGRGGMGVVYLAKNVLMDRLEVLKVMNRSRLDPSGATERFLREIRAAAKLNHDNVVKAYSALALGDLLIFAMEYVEGEDLARVVKQLGPMPIPNACFYTYQTALGLQHAHEQGMVHRDIKPANLILSRQGRKHVVKILDFGLAKATREGKTDAGLTGAGTMMGTPDFVAPEQALDAASADIRADVYSLGCTLYFLLTGSPPFEGNSLFEILQAHVSMQAKPLDQVRAGAPAELAAVVAKMIAKEPAQRYQQPADVAQALLPFVKAGAGESTAGSKSVMAKSHVAKEGAESEKSRTMKPAAARHETRVRKSPTATRAPEAAIVKPRRKARAGQGVNKPWMIAGAMMACVLLLGLMSVGVILLLNRETKDGAQGTLDSSTGAGTATAKIVAYEHGGRWRIEGDDLIQDAVEMNATGLLFGDASWTDYDFTVEAQRIAGSNLCSLAFRCTDSFNRYDLKIGRGDGLNRDLLLRAEGTNKLLAWAGWAADNSWHKIGVRVRGNHIECFMDGDRDFAVDDDTHPRGWLGLVTMKTATRFRNLKVMDSAGRILVGGVRDLMFSRGQATPINDQVREGTTWTGQLKLKMKGRPYPDRDLKIKILKRAGTRIEGEVWISNQTAGMKITGTVDPMGNITWTATGFIVQGSLADENRQTLYVGVVRGKQMRLLAGFATGLGIEVIATLEE